MTVQDMLQQALRHHQSRRLADAEELYLQILRLEPTNSVALNLLGVLAMQSEKPAKARQFLQRAIDLSPANGEFHFNLGLALAADNMPAEAEASFRKATLLSPRNPAAWNKLAELLIEDGKAQEAAAACRKALALQPKFPEACNTLGRAMFGLDDLDAAIAAFSRAVEQYPNFAAAQCNLGQAMCESGRYDQALVSLRRAIELKHNFALAHWNLALLLLRLGDFERGWPKFEARWRLPNVDMVMPYQQPWWDGGPLHGKRILLHAEQGFGDTIQFIRYLPMVIERGGKVLVVAQRELVPLLRCIGGVEQWLSEGDRLPEFDVHCPMLSLPGRFQTKPADIPAMVPYLTCEATCAERWRGRLRKYPRPRIGLAWTGSPINPENPTRSFPLAAMAPLGEATSGSFFSLQKGAAAAQSAAAPMPLVDWTDDLHDFADTAALMESLDLVITTDTSVAHLAGALGRPLWVLLKYVPDWRWFIDRSDSPWYPTAKLFRQPRRGDWSAPMRQAAEALRSL